MTATAETVRRRRYSGIVPVILLSVLILGSLTLLSNVTQNADQFEHLYSTLIVVNVLILLVLLILIGINLLRLINQYRRGVVGSRLTMRFVLIFVILAIVPVLLVYSFSLQFLNRGIDSWFDVHIDQVMQDAMELSRSALDLRMRELLKLTQGGAASLADVPGSMATLRLSELRAGSGASEVALLTQSGRIIASNSAHSTQIIPNRPAEVVLLQVRNSGSYVGLDPIVDSGLHVRVVVPIADTGPVGELRLLQALYPIAERMNQLAGSVQMEFNRYRQLGYLRKPLKSSFILTLSLVLLLSIFGAVWAAFVSAQRLSAPIRALEIGTRAVAEGKYDERIQMRQSDEFGTLIQSFNDMTRKIALAHEEVRNSQKQAENEHAYLKAVLGSLSSGVLTMDQHHVLRTVNTAAGKILGADPVQMIGKHIDNISANYSHLRPLVDALQSYLSASEEEWRQELSLLGSGGRQVLMCRGRALTWTDNLTVGYVVVFDDITALIQAERDAAWGEVARRIAHEIKNPLTPIQLSAERLRHKYLRTMDPESADLLDRSTHTIIQQVTAMKQMVQAFSEYARMPQLEMSALNLNDLINEVVDLYRAGEASSMVRLDLDPKVPLIDADASRLRQVLHNLLKNAFEATPDAQGIGIALHTKLVQESAHSFIELSVRDSGSGISEEMLEHLFEPYVTTKPKGTGLGLAIVKKIIEEHGGMVWAENCAQGGVTIVIRLPVLGSMVKH